MLTPMHPLMINTPSYKNTLLTPASFFILAKELLTPPWDIKHWTFLGSELKSLLKAIQYFNIKSPDKADEGFEEDDEFDESVIDENQEDDDFYEEEDDSELYEEESIEAEEETAENETETLAEDYSHDFDEDATEKTEQDGKDKLEEDIYENIDDFVDKESTFEDENEYFYGEYEE